jgi:DNA-binding transcriptional regulator YiaG
MASLTMQALREQTPFSRAAFARYAKISEETMRKMEEGIPVSHDSADKALSALNQLLRTSYTLDQIDVALLD